MLDRHKRAAWAAIALAGVAWPTLAAAQSAGEQLMAMDKSTLRGEIQSRHDAAVALTQDPSVINANNPRYIWASEAKAQCGIALGFLKSGTRDPVSIGKCADAALRMNQQPAPPPAPVSTVTPEICSQKVPGLIFFDWDSAVPPADAGQTVAYIAQNMQPCGWTGFDVIGHADRSGSDGYNQGLSERRANAIAGMLSSSGVASSALAVSGRGESEPRVPTADGVRELQNRRVEISVR